MHHKSNTIIEIYRKRSCHYLSYYIIRAKSIQSLMLLLWIVCFITLDKTNNFRFDCAMCTDYEGRRALYKSPIFNGFIVLDLICILR